MRTWRSGVCFLLLMIGNVARVNSGSEAVSVAGLDSGVSEMAWGDSTVSDLSPEGRFLTFQSTAPNIVPGVASKGYLHVYLRDQTDGSIRLASVNRTGTTGGNGHSSGARVSADGRYVVFESAASDLVWGDENGVSDVFLRDVIEERTVLISVNAGGANTGDGASWWPVLTPDGARVAFVSAATDLIQGDTNGYHDVFVRDVAAGTTTLASVGPATQTPYTMFQSESPVISADGRRVAFMASVHGLVATPRTLQWTILLRDLEGGQTYWVSTNVTAFTGGSQVRCYNPVMNEDGTWIAFKAQGGLVLRHHVDTVATGIVGMNAVDYGDVVEDLSGPSMSPDGQFIAYAGRDTPGALSQIYRWDAGTGDTLLVSANLDGNHGNGISDTPRVSADGGSVFFLSHATDLVGIETDGSSQLYVRDVEAGATRLLSLNPASETPTVHDVTLHWMNAEGNQVAFDLFDDALVAGDHNRFSDVFGVDLEAGTLNLFSTGFPGNPSSTAAGPSVPAKGGVSADGRYIAFVSGADDLVPNDTNGLADVFVRDLETGTTVLVSVNMAGASGNGASSRPVVSADGRHVAFESAASDLVANDLNSMPDVFVRDLVNGTTILASVKLDGTGSAELGATTPAISGDGRKVAFVSSSLDLATGAAIRGTRVFVRDLQDGETVVVGRDLPSFVRWSYDQPVLSTDGSAVVFLAPYNSQTRILRTVLSNGMTQRLDEPWEGSFDPSQFVSTNAVLSADGGRVAFVSDHPGLVPGDSNHKFDLFVTDLETGLTRLITLNTNGVSGNGDAVDAAISADGRWVAFTSLAGDLVPHDPNRGPGVQGWNRDRDVFLHDLETVSTTLVSRGSRESRSGNGPSDQPTISGDGRHVAYRSRASDLVAGDSNDRNDIFVYDRLTGINALASISHGLRGAGDRPSFRPTLSQDGSILVFGSHASDLIHFDYNEATDIFWSPIPLPGGLSSFAAELSVSSTDRVTVRWRPTGAGTYGLEYRDALTVGDWRHLEASIVIEAGWARVVDVLPQGVRQRYYRVAFTAQPQ